MKSDESRGTEPRYCPCVSQGQNRDIVPQGQGQNRLYICVSLSLMSLTVPHGSRGKEQGSKAALSFPCPRLVKLSLNEIILRGELIEI
nr:MAG TPA: hypothetical protein [Caudoviricetes sp.]